MPEFHGKTDEVKQFKLQSYLLSIRWGATEVPIGGTIPVEVMTIYVADGSDIDISIKDLQGNEIEKLKGKVYSNCFRALYILKYNSTGVVYAQGELPSHNLKGRTPALKLLPPIEIKNPKWLDDSGAEVKEANEDDVVKLAADIKGADGKRADILVYCSRGDTESESKMVLQTNATVENGKVEADWILSFHDSLHTIKGKQDLEKEGLTYYQPQYYFEVHCLGVSAKSPELKLLHSLTLIYESEPGKAGIFAGKKISITAPDGAKSTHVIPADGKLEIKKTLPGIYTIDEAEIKKFL
jgi:hypothetical protein